jgi:hypothetical protein
MLHPPGQYGPPRLVTIRNPILTAHLRQYPRHAGFGWGITQGKKSLKLSLKKCTETEPLKRLMSIDIHWEIPRK